MNKLNSRLRDLGPAAVSAAVAFALVYGLLLLLAACVQQAAAKIKVDLQPSQQYTLGNVKLQGFPVTCEVAGPVLVSVQQELEVLTQRIADLTEPEPVSESDPELVVLGHVWTSVYKLKNDLEVWQLENGCLNA